MKWWRKTVKNDPKLAAAHAASIEERLLIAERKWRKYWLKWMKATGQE